MQSLCFSLVLILALAAPAAGGTIHVPADQPSISHALAFATSGDTVLVAPGTYLESGLGIRGGVTLRGATGDPADVVVDAGGLGRVIYAEEMAPGTRLEAITITGGNISEAAGIRIGHASLDLADCIIANNSVDIYGGGVYLPFEDSTATFTRCTFTGNTAGTGGGAVYAWTASELTFTDCTFDGNSAGLYGGAILCYQVDFAITGSTFVSNEAGLYGGGIYLESCQIYLNRCLITDSTSGGALKVITTPDLILSCCDFWGNTGGDWVAPFDILLGVNGNISEDPQFCGVEGSGNYFLQSDSPCASPGSGCGAYIGAWPVGCEAAATASTSWSELKSLY